MATLSTLPDTFYRFPRLPEELRRRIWKLAAFEPRLLNIQLFRPSEPSESPQDLGPAILRVSQESRSEALRFYTKAFLVETTQRYTWTNFDVDIIKIDDQSMPLVSDEQRAQIQWLIVIVDDIECFFWYHYPWDYEKMVGLRDMEFLSVPDVTEWGFWISTMRNDFIKLFGEVKGWKCPEIKVTEQGSGFELNFQNYEANIMGKGRSATRGSRTSRGRGYRGRRR